MSTTPPSEPRPPEPSPPNSPAASPVVPVDAGRCRPPRNLPQHTQLSAVHLHSRPKRRRVVPILLFRRHLLVDLLGRSGQLEAAAIRHHRPDVAGADDQLAAGADVHGRRARHPADARDGALPADGALPHSGQLPALHPRAVQPDRHDGRGDQHGRHAGQPQTDFRHRHRRAAGGAGRRGADSVHRREAARPVGRAARRTTFSSTTR